MKTKQKEQDCPVCSGEMSSSQLVQEHVKLITEFGWSVIGVGAGVGMPTFAYTTGMTAKCGTDFCLVGLRAEVAHHSFVNLWVEYVKDGGILDVADNACLTEIANFPVYIRKLDDKSPHFRLGQAATDQHTGIPGIPGAPYNMAQLVFPDQHGKYPWDAGYSMQSVKQEVFKPHWLIQN